jgi:hypothetical protein
LDDSVDVAVRRLIRALALDPWLGRGRAALLVALERLGKAAPRFPAGEAGLGSPRPILLVGRATELASNPDLLRAYAKRFGNRDDIALVGYQAEEIDDSAKEQFGISAASAGLEVGPDRAVELLSGLPDGALETELAGRALACFTEGPPILGPAGPWTFGLAQLDDLCDFVAAYRDLSQSLRAHCAIAV